MTKVQESDLSVRVHLGVVREAAELLETVGCDDYVNPPTAEDMQRVAAGLRRLLMEAT